MTDFNLTGMAETGVVAGVGAAIALWGRSLVAANKDDTQEKEMTRLATETEKKLMEAKADHAREIGEVRGASAAAHNEVRSMMQRISDKMNEIDRKMDGFSVALVGIDGKNGIRGEVTELHLDHRDLRERVMRLDFAVRRVTDVQEQ